MDYEAVSRDLTEQIGRIRRKPLGRVTALHFTRFAIASQEEAPRYFSDEQARSEGFPAVVAPPLFLSAVMGWVPGPDEDELRTDGLGDSETEDLPLGGLRIMGAGQDLEFFHPVVEGLEVTEETSVDDVQLKHGRSGTLIIYTLLRRYLDQDERELARCRENFIGR